MTIFGLMVSSALVLISNDILKNEFGVYNDDITIPPAALELRTRNIYKRHTPKHRLPHISPRNSSGPIRAENSQFNKRSFNSGTTLGKRGFSSSPMAPSRFSRP